jgi:hypothetical protein
MHSKSILQMVSGFKPSIDGMGDFARRLGNVLWQRSNFRSHFVVYRTPAIPFDAREIHPSSISYPTKTSPSAFFEEVAKLRRQHNFDCALLHYGSYAYSPNGRPAAFVEMIEELAKDMRVLVCFHEVYASGMPWKRAFWTKREQRESARKLLRIASAAFTSNSEFMQGLEALNDAGRTLTKIPIFSNVGEPESLRPLEHRSRQLVVFGQLTTRTRLYRNHRKALENVCRRLRIERVVDAGSGESSQIPHMLAGVEVRSTGEMDEQALSDLMADSIAGIVSYSPDVWEKSGVIAAYQAHALVPILVELKPRRIPAPSYLPYILAKDIPHLSGENGWVSDASIQQIAGAAHEHYMRSQSVSRCADLIAECAIQR